LAKEKLASNPKLDRTQAYEQSFIDLKN
jgi:hypothetical protein